MTPGHGTLGGSRVKMICVKPGLSFALTDVSNMDSGTAVLYRTQVSNDGSRSSGVGMTFHNSGKRKLASCLVLSFARLQSNQGVKLEPQPITKIKFFLSNQNRKPKNKLLKDQIQKQNQYTVLEPEITAGSQGRSQAQFEKYCPKIPLQSRATSLNLQL
uniref:Uncharacterized protein n=1 Tax=Timema bartmani TaxID=61472 RepID=A0A7R9I1W0_9NEOP|nr:unnamed protein product [Timema bartmani]